MTGRLILLNGASSSGKTALARALQEELPGHWLRLSIDDLVAALPMKLRSGEGIEFGPQGQVKVGQDFRALEQAWMTGIAAMVRAGASIILDDVFLGGVASQGRWQAVLGDLPVCWVAVHCRLDVAEAREQARRDRTPGMYRQQREAVHQRVDYDLQIDTSELGPPILARQLRHSLKAYGFEK